MFEWPLALALAWGSVSGSLLRSALAAPAALAARRALTGLPVLPVRLLQLALAVPGDLLPQAVLAALPVPLARSGSR